MRKVVLVLAVVSVALVGCGGGGDSGDGGGGGGGGACTDLSSGSTFTIKQQDTQFSPNCVIAKRSQGLTLTNSDGVTHTFTIDNTPIDVEIQAGTTQNLDPINDGIDPGTYTFYCRFHGQPDGTGIAGKSTGS